MNKVIIRSLGSLALVAAVCPAVAEDSGTQKETVTNIVSSANILGIKRTPGGAQKEIAIGVPWLGTEGEPVTIDRLIATGVQERDVLKVYDNGTKGYIQWERKNGEWRPVSDAQTGGDDVWPEDYSVSRGMALWLTRSDVAAPFSQIGLYTTDAVSTPVVNQHANGDAATLAKPVYNLMFSPKSGDFNLGVVTNGCSNGDAVLIISTGQLYTFKRNKNITAWGCVGSDDGKWVPSSISIPGNTAFWYMSAGGNPNIVW